MRILVLLFAPVMLAAFIGCGGNDSNPFDREPTYEEKKMSIEEEERANPARFLTASGTYRENFSGTKMKVFGKVTSTATVANFKDVVIEFTYYSSTDTELGSDRYVLYEFVNAGKTVSFNWKLDVPSACTKLGWDVVSATPY